MSGSDDDDLITIDATPTAEEERRSFETEEEKRSRIENLQAEQDLGQRLIYGERAYGIACSWTGFIIVVTMCQISLRPIGIFLPTEEFIAVIVSVTASMFGFWLLVGRYLFPRR